MKRAISLLLVIVMTTIALAGCDSKSENPAGNANSKQPTDESITIKNSPDKYTWYIKNYVGKNCASIGYTSMGGDRMDHYGAGYIELVMVTPDGAYIHLWIPNRFDCHFSHNIRKYKIRHPNRPTSPVSGEACAHIQGTLLIRSFQFLL